MNDASIEITLVDLRHSTNADFALLSADEQQRAQRFHFERDATAYIACRSRLRRILALHTGLAPSTLTFRYGEHGKPELAPPWSAVFFSVSHSGTLGLIGVGKAPLGIDLEYMKPIPELEAIAAQHFAAEEQDELFSIPSKHRLEIFYRCWTRKEAFVKIHGDGIASAPLQRFAIGLDIAPCLTRLDDVGRGLPTDYRLFHLTPAPGYVGALAVAHTQADYRYMGRA